MIVLAALRDSSNLEGGDLAEAIGLLAGLADHEGASGQGDPAVDRLHDLVEQHPELPLAAVADWWLVVRFGLRAIGPAYDLPAELGSDLLARMTRLRDVGRPLSAPPLVWLRQHRQLRQTTQRLDSSLAYSGKVGAEANAWDRIQQRYRPILKSIDDGEQPDSPDLAKSNVRDFMREEGVTAGSDRWRKLERAWDDVDEAARRVLEVARGLRPILGGPEVAAGPAPAVGWSDAATAAALLLLHDLMEGRPPVEDATAAALAEIAVGTPEDLAWLACLSWRWRRALPTERSVPPLDPLWRRISLVHTQLERLQREGVDTGNASARLDAGDLAGAEATLEAARGERARQDRARGLHDEAVRLRHLVTEAPEDDQEHLCDSLDLVDADIADGMLDDAARRLDALRDELSETVESYRLRRATEALEQLEALSAEVPRRLVEPVRRASAGGQPLNEADALHLEKLLEQVRASTQARVDEQRRKLERRFEQEGGAADPADADQIRDALDAAVSSLADGRLAEAERQLDKARGLLDERVPRTWEAADGEAELVEHLRMYVRQRVGFAANDVLRLYVALKTKRFVILAGLTGSGKTTIARLFAEAVGATPDNGRFVRVAVRPNWIDESEVLGYVNPVSNRFEPGWLATLMRTCHEHPDEPVFCLLDEMNLAPVEHYFADFLSAIEEARASAPAVAISLYSPGAAPENRDDWPSTINLPDNLFVIGTVNVDESTRALSDRVLDRANVLQLSVDVGRAHHEGPSAAELVPRRIVRMRDWRQVCRAEPNDGHHDFLVEVASVFTHQLRIGLGVRNHVEIERFHANAEGVLDEQTTLDLVLLQRIIPKIRGFKRDLAPGLTELRRLFEEVGADRCVAVLDDWLGAAVSDETYLDGTDARIGLVTSFS